MAYPVDGDVFYSVTKFPGYGKLSGKNIEELESGARVEVDPRKENPWISHCGKPPNRGSHTGTAPGVKDAPAGISSVQSCP